MAKHIIRYLLDGDNRIPAFVECGGFYKNGEELVGLSIDDAKRYLPSTVQVLTKSQLITRIILAEKKEDGTDYSEAEATDIANAFLTSVGLPDYA